MTDNEIIKALECCNKPVGYNSCVDCPLYEVDNCSETMIIFTLDLINRQNAKIESLQMDNQQLQSDIANANMNAEHALAEIERLEKHDLQEAMKFNRDTINRSANEAVKEFAEKLKENVTYHVDECDEFVPWVDCKDIDNLLNELGVEG